MPRSEAARRTTATPAAVRPAAGWDGEVAAGPTGACSRGRASSTTSTLRSAGAGSSAPTRPPGLRGGQQQRLDAVPGVALDLVGGRLVRASALSRHEQPTWQRTYLSSVLGGCDQLGGGQRTDRLLYRDGRCELEVGDVEVPQPACAGQHLPLQRPDRLVVRL